MDIANMIKKLRVDRGLTQKQLATESGLSERGIQNYESGRRKPTLDALITLADFFNVSLDYLVGRIDEDFPPYNEVEK